MNQFFFKMDANIMNDDEMFDYFEWKLIRFILCFEIATIILFMFASILNAKMLQKIFESQLVQFAYNNNYGIYW